MHWPAANKKTDVEIYLLLISHIGSSNKQKSIISSFLPSELSTCLKQWINHLGKQAVRSSARLRFTCYQASTCRLSTRSSSWDLHSKSGKTHLGSGFALRCFQRFSFLDVAIQLWQRLANWHTSGPAISVLSY